MQACQVEQGENQVIINELMDKAEKQQKKKKTKKLNTITDVSEHSGPLMDTEQIFNTNSQSSREISTR